MSEQNVVNLEARKREPDLRVVERLKDLLARAESGQLRALAFVANYGQGCGTGITGQWNKPELTYSLAVLQHQNLMEDWKIAQPMKPGEEP